MHSACRVSREEGGGGHRDSEAPRLLFPTDEGTVTRFDEQPLSRDALADGGRYVTLAPGGGGRRGGWRWWWRGEGES